MQAIEFRHFGDPSQLHLVQRPDPHATAFTAVVRMEAASINPSDVKNVAGRMSQTTLPRVPGRDYSGVVVEGPAEWIGVPVWGTGGDLGFTRDGTHAEYIEVPLASLVRKPESLTFEAAASVGVTFLTAWIGVVEYARLSKGETLAVIGVGGVGGAAIQLAKYVGADAIAIGRGQSVDGIHADVVLDTVGGAMIETALRIAAHRGRVIEITGPKDRRVSFDIIDFYHHELQLLGVDSLQRDLTAASETLRSLAPGFESGALLAPVVSKLLPLEQAQEGYKLVAEGSPGRVVLKGLMPP
jgi:NADPH:quinone reductase-like Zn-dependent oxidoreductase